MPATEMKGNPTKEYVSLGRIGYGGTKKPKFDPSAGRDYDADAKEDPEGKPITPTSSRMQRPGKSKITTDTSAEPVPVVPVALSPA